MRERSRDADMVKVEILLSSLAGAACTASVGIAVWKLVFGRAPPAPDADEATDSSAQDANVDKASMAKLTLSDSTTEGEDREMIDKQARHEWAVGGSREWLLRSMADPSGTKPAQERDWDSASDITEWSSVADDDDVFDACTSSRSYQPLSSVRQRSIQHPTRWAHVGYGRYVKV
jgi:hypothetical protein